MNYGNSYSKMNNKTFFAIHPNAVLQFVGKNVYISTTERGEYPAFISSVVFNSSDEATVVLVDLTNHAPTTISTQTILQISPM